MLQRLARIVVRRRRLVLIATAVGFVVAGGIGGNVAQHLSSGGFSDTAAESSKANVVLEKAFGSGQPNLLLVVTAPTGKTVDDPAVAAAGIALTKELAGRDGITATASYWSLGNVPPLRSVKGNRALVLATIAGDEDEVRHRVEEISPAFNRSTPELTSQVGGFAEVFREVGTTIEKDLSVAEAIALPLTLLLLVLVFGGLVAASLPLGIGALSVVGTFLVLRVMAELTQVSIFALNLTTAMGLGLAIDYSLFVVSRFREEQRNGLSVEDAVVRSVDTAGRTVLFSAGTVAASLLALLVFPLAFLRSFAYAGIAVVAIAALASVVCLPALLAALGPRVDKLSLRRKAVAPPEEGLWHRIALTVMKRPVLIGVSVIVVLLFLGAPFLGIRFGLPDDRVLPTSASSRRAHDILRHEFASTEAGALSVVAPGTALAGNEAKVSEYAAKLSSLKGVARVDAATGFFIGGAQLAPPIPASARFANDKGVWFSVVPTGEPLSAEGEQVVKDVRSVARPFDVLVTGSAAQLVDSKASIFAKLPLAGGLIALITFVVLFLFTGSVLVPVKAVVLNLLSLTATFGAMVWIFQEGHLAGLLHFTPTGAIDVTTPILMFCVAFGLSMDYEVFLLSRIKEEHDRTGDNVRSVAVGLERTGKLVTAAAALLAVVFTAFATSKVSFIKLFGVGLTMAVLMDATVIRGLLVPAFMRLAGDANWWAPAPLKRLHARIGIREAADVPAPADPEPVIDITDKPRRPRPLKAAGR